MATAKRFRERRAEMEFRRAEEKKDKANKDVMGKLGRMEQYLRNREARCYGLHRRAEVRILEGSLKPVSMTRIIFWSPERIRNDPFIRARVIRQNNKRKKSKG